MRRLLAVILVLALGVGLPATTSADKSSEGEGSDDTEAPQPPPSDAVGLAVDAEPYEARIDELHEVDWYRFTTVAGGNYWILPDAGGDSLSDVDISALDIFVSVHDADGTDVGVAARSGGGLRSVFLVEARAATYFVRISLGAYSVDPVADYRIEVRTVGDDHGNTAATGTVVRPGSAVTTVHAGEFEYRGDEDWLLFDARAGDTYRITSRWSGVGLGVHAIDPGGDPISTGLSRWGTAGSYGDVDGKPWHFERSGRYAVVVHDTGGNSYWHSFYPRGYDVTFERLADDHANLPNDPSPLRPGDRTEAILEYEEDEDWFAVHLVKGEAYVAEFSSGSSERLAVQVILYGVRAGEDEHDDMRSGQTLLSYPGRTRQVWQAAETGRHLVNIRTVERRSAASFPADYSIAISRLPADDHADGPDGASAIRPDEPIEATLEMPDDEDWFRFDAKPGVTYAVEFDVRTPGTEISVPLRGSGHERRIGAYFLDGGWGFDPVNGYAFATAGTHYLVVAGHLRDGESLDYHVQLVEHESVDHSDDRLTARPLQESEGLIGSVSDQDADWFVLDTRAAGFYAVTYWSEEASIEVFDDTAEVPSRGYTVGFREPLSRLLWYSPAPGRYWIRLSSRWATPFAYRLGGISYWRVAPDDHGDSAAEATEVILTPGTDVRLGESADSGGGSSHAPLRIAERQAEVEGRLETYLDSDWFALHLRRGVKYRILGYAHDPDPDDSYVSFDHRVRFGFRDGQRAISSRDESDQALEFGPAATGTYHMVVDPAWDAGLLLAPQPYSLEVQVLDADDVGDLREDGASVAAGAAAAGLLDSSNDVDWFRFHALEGQTWILRFAKGSIHLAEVYAPGETEPLAADRSDDGLLLVAPTTGEYGLRLSQRSGPGWSTWYGDRRSEEPTEYRATLALVEPDDHGNSAGVATALAAGEGRTGRIDYAGDRDVFRLTVAKGDVWRLEASFDGDGMTHSARFAATGSAATSPGVTSRYAAGDVLAAPAGGAWLITVWGEESPADYSLAVERLDAADDYGNDRAHAHGLATPPAPDPNCGTLPGRLSCPRTTSVGGTIGYEADADYFRVRLEAGAKYEFRVRSSSEAVIFDLLTEASCAWVPGRRGWERTYDTWVPEATEDYWVRVGLARDRYSGPVGAPRDLATYTLEITDRGDEFLTHAERVTELEPNVVHSVAGDESTGSDFYRVRMDRPNLVIEVIGAGFGASGINPAEQFFFEFAREGSRSIIPIPRYAPDGYPFKVSGPAGRPYTVVARARVPSDEDLDWRGVNVTPAFPPDYCWRAGDESWR